MKRWHCTNVQNIAETMPNYERVFEIRNSKWNDFLVRMCKIWLNHCRTINASSRHKNSTWNDDVVLLELPNHECEFQNNKYIDDHVQMFTILLQALPKYECDYEIQRGNEYSLTNTNWNDNWNDVFAIILECCQSMTDSPRFTIVNESMILNKCSAFTWIISKLRTRLRD